MPASLPRFLLPRGPLLPRYQVQLLRQAWPAISHTSPTCRHASASASKPRVLEKPTRFNPPSHGKRLREHVPRHYGPELTIEQKTEQKTKQYPNMMPPPGSFMFWFLTNRSIHTFITLGTLVLLAAFTAFENFRRDTPFREQLPAREDLLWHPISSISQVIHLWKMSVHEKSTETAIRRKRNVDDVQKRNAYRKAHGIEESQGLPGWFGKDEEQAVGANAMAGNLDGAVGASMGEDDASPTRPETPASRRNAKEAPYVDWDGNRKPVKKWLGIW